jgi:hypothetical protein
MDFRVIQSNRWNGLRCCQYIRGQRPASFQGSNEQEPRRNGATLRYRKFGKDWRGSDGAKAKLNQINTFLYAPQLRSKQDLRAYYFFPG